MKLKYQVEILIHKYFTIVFLVLLSLLSSQQMKGQTTDFETWEGVKISFDLPKRFEATLKEQLRMKNNSSEVKGVLTEVGAAYSINKYFNFGLSYRHTIKPLGANRNRVTFIAKQKYKVKPFTLGNRIKLQKEYQSGKLPDNYLRDKMSIGLKISKKIKAEFGNEWFYHIKTLAKQFDQYRLGLSFNFKLNKRNHIEAGYIYEKQFNIGNPATTHMGIINYKLSLL